MCYGVFTPDGTEDFIYIECEHTISLFLMVYQRGAETDASRSLQ